MHKFDHQIKGFTLLEVLIAVFVLAIGVLGIAGLQLFAKQSSYDAIQRTTATAMATTIAERIRMNADSADDYLSSVAPIPATALPATCDTAANGCTPQQLAARDLQEWQSAIIGTYESSGGNNAGGLVAPSACITSPAAGEYRIAIAWRGRSPLSNPTIDDCGVDAQVGGTNVYGANNEYRRLFVMDLNIE